MKSTDLSHKLVCQKSGVGPEATKARQLDALQVRDWFVNKWFIASKMWVCQLFKLLLAYNWGFE